MSQGLIKRILQGLPQKAIPGTLRFNLMYLGHPPWDSGITPPEVVEVVESGVLSPSRAVDLGCGTGTNAIYLAQHGFQVDGIDSALLAILKARRKARRQDATVRFHVGKVTRLPFLTHPVRLALDIGCLHGLQPEDRLDYAQEVGRVVAAGGHYMLYAWGRHGQRGLDPGEVQALFAPFFDTVWVRGGQERGAPSSWYLMRKRPPAAP